MLTHTTTILHRNRATMFISEEGSRATSLVLDPDVYADMDSPQTITVTIEPGDSLNLTPKDT